MIIQSTVYLSGSNDPITTKIIIDNEEVQDLGEEEKKAFVEAVIVDSIFHDVKIEWVEEKEAVLS